MYVGQSFAQHAPRLDKGICGDRFEMEVGSLESRLSEVQLSVWS
jgi:hypothetical protein